MLSDITLQRSDRTAIGTDERVPVHAQRERAPGRAELMSTQVTPRTLAMILAAAVAVLAVGGWFGLVASQRSSASSLDAQVEDAKANLAALRRRAGEDRPQGQRRRRAAKAAQSRASQLKQLEAAFPKAVDMPSILLQIQKLATQSKRQPAVVRPVASDAGQRLRRRAAQRHRQRALPRHPAVRPRAPRPGDVDSRPASTRPGRLFAVDTVGISRRDRGPSGPERHDPARRVRLQRRRAADRVGQQRRSGSTTTTTSEGTSP